MIRAAAAAAPASTVQATSSAPVVDLAAHKLAKHSAETRELLELGWWWIVEDNPPCVSWCTMVHSPDEFRETGALTCWRPVGHVGAQTIAASRFQGADPGQPGSLTCSTSVTVLGGQDIDLEPCDVDAFCAALSTAAAVCEGIDR